MPRVRRRVHVDAPPVPDRHLLGAGDLDGGQDRGGPHEGRRSLRGRRGPLPRDRARRDPRRRHGHPEAHRAPRIAPAPRRPHPRHGGDRARPHRPGRSRVRGHARRTSSRRCSTTRRSRSATRSRRWTPSTSSGPKPASRAPPRTSARSPPPARRTRSSRRSSPPASSPPTSRPSRTRPGGGTPSAASTSRGSSASSSGP